MAENQVKKDAYKENLGKIQSNHLTRELLMYMKHPESYKLEMGEKELYIAMLNLIKIDQEVHHFKLEEFLIPYVLRFYLNIEVLPKFLEDPTFNLEAVEKALDKETSGYFNTPEFNSKFKKEREVKIKETTPPENLEEMLNRFNQTFKQASKDPKLIYAMV